VPGRGATGRRIVPSKGDPFRKATESFSPARWEKPSPPSNYASDISYRRATSSRNQRATSSESAHHRHRSPTLPPSPKTATCLRMSVAALYSTHTTGPSILYGPEQPHLFPVQRFPASRQWYLWPVHHHHRCKNDAPNDRHAQEGHADVAQNPSYAFS